MSEPRATGRWTRRDLLRGVAGVGVGTFVGTAAHGYLYEREAIEVTRATLEVSGLPESLSGLRVGFLSDFHRSDTVSHELVQTAVNLVLQEHPDLIVLGGDYVTQGDRRYMEPAAEALAPLTAPHGVIAVLGNHDDDHQMPGALTRRGFVVLRDARTRLTIRGETVDIAGIRYWTRRIADIALVLRGASPTLMFLAHTPARLPEAASLSVPLMLSGHTHGGQIVLPGIGPWAARHFPVVAGTARKENTTVFVSRGVGTVYIPVRVNCRPEVALLTLRPRTLE